MKGMRGWHVVVVLAGCTSAPAVELSVDVRVTRERLTIYPREVERPCTCTYEFPQPGECTEIGDLLSCRCDPGPASCLESIRIERGAQVVMDQPFETTDFYGDWSTTVALATGDELVITGCGASGRVPIELDHYPTPSITQVDVVDTSLHMAWNASGDPHSSIVSFPGRWGAATRCHGVFDGIFDGTLPYPATDGFAVQTLIRREHSTELGLIRTWTGGSDSW